MKQDYWRQQADKPLFPNLLWSRPETRHGAGKLLLIGGQAQEFSLAAEAYSEAEKSGAGTVRVIMPESTRKFTSFLPNVEYAPANNSGSFSAAALAELLDAADWADAVMLAGNLGKNSETSLMLEKLISEYNGLLVISDDAAHSLAAPAKAIFKRPDTIIAVMFATIRKQGIELGLTAPLTSNLNSSALAEVFHGISGEFPAAFLVQSDNFIWTAYGGKVSSTKPKNYPGNVSLASSAAVWSMQNPGKLFESLTAAAYC